MAVIGGEHAYFPTPPGAGLQLAAWLREHGHHLGFAFEPCAGAGALVEWLSAVSDCWACWDIDERHREALESRGDVDDVAIADSLRYRWPDLPAVSNPPFGKLLDPFAHKMLEHRDKHGVLCALLTRWNAWGDRERVTELHPDVLGCVGRHSFDGSGGSDFTAHVWAIWLPEPTGQTVTVDLPRVKPTARQSAIYRRMCG